MLSVVFGIFLIFSAHVASGQVASPDLTLPFAPSQNDEISPSIDPLAGLDPQKVNACFSLYPIAKSALVNKENGLSKEAMLAPLPSRKVLSSYPQDKAIEKMVSLSVLDIVDEVYRYKGLEGRVYSVYTAEVCQRKLRGVAVPESFSESHKGLKKCASEAKSKQISCAMAVAGSTR
ncbi:MAG: hypothetical protein COB04_14355 [Gammaproteobacteria bacterium]|nr:MAG: hypothetical protein COB04_14355 [Gammaproteobacteria bacterium]